MTLANNDLKIGSDLTNVSFALVLESSTASGYMLAEMKGMYQVPVEPLFDRFGIPIPLHAKFVAEVSNALTRSDAGGEEKRDLERPF